MFEAQKDPIKIYLLPILTIIIKGIICIRSRASNFADYLVTNIAKNQNPVKGIEEKSKEAVSRFSNVFFFTHPYA